MKIMQEVVNLRITKAKIFKKLGKDYAESLNKILTKEVFEVLKSEGSDDPEMDERFTDIAGDFMEDFIKEFNEVCYVSTEDLEL